MAKSLFAKQAYQVQTGGAQSVALPFGWTKVLIASPGAVSLKRRQKQKAVRSHHEGWQAINRTLVPNLGVL
jgi:hypothetical protein